MNEWHCNDNFLIFRFLEFSSSLMKWNNLYHHYHCLFCKQKKNINKFHLKQMLHLFATLFFAVNFLFRKKIFTEIFYFRTISTVVYWSYRLLMIDNDDVLERTATTIQNFLFFFFYLTNSTLSSSSSLSSKKKM